MNIGEISKPSIERSELKQKKSVQPSEPVAPAPKVSTSVDLSDESKRQLEDEQQHKKNKLQKDPRQKNSADEEQTTSGLSIDIEI